MNFLDVPVLVIEEAERINNQKNYIGFKTESLVVTQFTLVNLKEKSDHYMFLVKRPTYPSPKPTLTNFFPLKAKCWLRGGVGGPFYVGYKTESLAVIHLPPVNSKKNTV